MANFTLTADEEKIVIADWISAIHDLVWDENNYPEIIGKERAQIEKSAKRAKRLTDDFTAFGQIMLEAKKLWAAEFESSNPTYSLDIDSFTYGGTECRTWYRSYLALLGYKSFAGTIDVSNFDFPSVAGCVKFLTSTKAFWQYRNTRVSIIRG